VGWAWADDWVTCEFLTISLELFFPFFLVKAGLVTRAVFGLLGGRMDAEP
jgi:hypothetical protein